MFPTKTEARKRVVLVMSIWLQFEIEYDFNISKCDPDGVHKKHAYIHVGSLFQHYLLHGVGMYFEFTTVKYSALSSHFPRAICALIR
jgi:hypothetical protein